jgi:hypothetical protein
VKLTTTLRLERRGRIHGVTLPLLSLYVTYTVVLFQPATSWLHYSTNFNTQSSAPEDG